MALDKIDAIRKTPLFSGLSEAELHALSDRAVEQKLARGEILFLSGDPAKGLYVIVEGAVRAFRVGADGREQVIHVERAGATVGEVPVFDEGAYPSTVAGEEDGKLLFIGRDEVKRLCFDHPGIAWSALRVMARRLRNCASLVETLSLHDVDRRLARFLLEEARIRGSRRGAGMQLDFQMTHQQVAARIGTVREVVSRAFSRLQQAGLIRIQSKAVVVENERKLASFVEGETA
jgi:CRP/FNR family transcriptional regulator